MEVTVSFSELDEEQVNTFFKNNNTYDHNSFFHQILFRFPGRSVNSK